MRVPPIYRRWVTCPEPRPDASFRLFCFHFSGGDASVFRLWPIQLPKSIEVCPIELPGRATRRTEPPITLFPELLEKMAGMVRPFLKQLPYAFFGHSFGGITAFELTRWLRRNGQPLPVHLFLSACPAMHLQKPVPPPLSPLPDLEFLERISARFGVPREVLTHADVRNELLPVLRTDALIAESYHYAPEPPLEVPISSFGGWDDPEVHPREVEAWAQQTTAGFRVRMLPGPHLFLSAERRQLHKAILEDLQVAH